MTLPFKNTAQSFGVVARAFHWSMALVMLGLLALGFWMVWMPVSPFKFELYGWHKSFGLVILGFGVMRLFWRFMSVHPAALPSHAQWERFLSITIHIVLYISIIGMPLSGWLMSSAGEYPVRFFGMFDMPVLSGKNEALYDLMKVVHELFSFALIGAIGLHIAGALKHALLDRDETLRRMGGRVWIGILALAVLCVPATFAVLDIAGRVGKASKVVEVGSIEGHDSAAVSPLSADVQSWVIDSGASSLEFAFDQYGQSVSGYFEAWSGEIAFDPDNLAGSAAVIRIDISSIRTGSATRDAQAHDGEWFDVAAHPFGVFESESFEALGANRYRVHGALSLRGVELPVSFPFSLKISEKDGGRRAADMDADLVLERLAFGIGQGQWKSAEAIGNSVNIRLKVRAETP